MRTQLTGTVRDAQNYLVDTLLIHSSSTLTRKGKADSGRSHHAAQEEAEAVIADSLEHAANRGYETQHILRWRDRTEARLRVRLGQ
jgi:hypothetical protein